MSTLMCPPELFRIDLGGKNYLVTGGAQGIGRATTEQLVRQGARVIVACRNVGEAKEFASEMRNAGAPGTIEVEELDLANLESVRRFAQRFLEKEVRLDALVNNAGVMNTPLSRTKDGFEMQFGVNHLGHFLLTESLLPLLEKSAPSRIVNLSSCYHDRAFGRVGKIEFEDLNFERRKYDGWGAYAQSKLANVVYSRELAARLANKGVTVASVHPGWVRTRLMRYSLPLWVQNFFLFRPFFRLGGMIEPFEGAQTTLYTLLSPKVPALTGEFFSQTGIYRDKAARRGGWPLRSPNPEAHDDALGRRLSQVSRKLVGLSPSPAL